MQNKELRIYIKKLRIYIKKLRASIKSFKNYIILIITY